MPEETSDTYYNYDDYIHFKSKFEDQDSVSFDIEIIERNPVIKTINQNVRSFLTHVCKKLKEFLSYIDSNEETNLTKCCSYINYHLTDKIQSSRYDPKNVTFAYFQTFLQHEPKLKSNVCTSQMKYLDDGIYNKMKLLYELYDIYEALNDRIVSINDKAFCTELKDLVTIYNKIIGGYKISESKYLFMELKNIKCLIDKSNLMSKTNCDNDIPDLLSPKEKDEDFLKPCTEMDEATGEEKPRADVQENTESLAQQITGPSGQEIAGIKEQQGNIRMENGRAESSPEVHPGSLGTHPDVGFQDIRNMEAPPEDSPPSVASKTIATTASVAAIFVPSYLMYKVNMIMIEKLNVTAYN